MIRFVGLAALLLLGACATQAGIPYSPASPPAVVAGARPIISVGEVVDARKDGREDANWVGTIRGGYGNPLKRLETPVPVRDAVAQAFREALAARGLAAPATGAYELRVRIVQFDASQYVRREATAEFQLTLYNRATGAQVWSETGRSHVVDGSLLAITGVFADIEDLRQTALRAMTQAIDDALNRPSLAVAIRG
ncbi:hypothetical protein VQH23_21495 [Pararoseomonas sp. SCSIO 73927]|uniref:hypothetical protein n=1 Tax=Pararoseomonas sp. SCSIO 73927 TaxID=3114537 RepID=UPI0030CBE085